MIHHIRAVEIGAAISVGSFSISLASVVPVFQLIAACVGIFAGICAIVAFYKRK